MANCAADNLEHPRAPTFALEKTLPKRQKLKVLAEVLKTLEKQRATSWESCAAWASKSDDHDEAELESWTKYEYWPGKWRIENIA